MPKCLGVDLGTTSTLIYSEGEGIIFNEPSVIAVNSNTGEPLSFGNEAREMLGRTPESIDAFSPLKYGVIASFDMTVAMLKKFIGKVVKSSFVKPRVIVTIPSKATEVEKRAVVDVVLKAGAKEVCMIESLMAAAIGAGIAVSEPAGSMVVNIGGGITEVAVISLGGIVTSNSIEIAGNEIDNAIIQYLKKKHNIMTGEITAEEIKNTIGSAYGPKDTTTMEIKGRDMVSGLPVVKRISADEVRTPIFESSNLIVDAIKATLEKTPPELAADIMDSGIVLTGGGALLKGLGKLINASTEIPVYIAENPIECVAIGAGSALNISAVKRASMITRKRR